MVAYGRRVLAAPVFVGDEAKTRSAFMLNALLLMAMALTVALVPVLALERDRGLWMPLGLGVLAELGLWGLLHRGQVNLASALVVLVLWLGWTVDALGAGRGRAPWFAGEYLGVVVVAGVLGRYRGTLAAIALCTLSTCIQGGIADPGALAAVGSYSGDLLKSRTGGMGLVAVVLMVATRHVDQTLARLHRELAEKSRAERALAESTAKIRAVFELASEGIVFTDLEGRVTDLNRSAVRMYNYASKADALGQNALDRVAEPSRARARISWHLMRIRDRGGPNEYIQMTRTGREFAADVEAVQLRDAGGAPTGFVVFVRDITERKRVAEALRSSEEKFRTWVEMAPVAILVRRDDRIAYANRTFLRQFGYVDSDAICGRPLTDYFAPECREQVAGFAQRRKQGLPAPQEYESVGRRADGSCFCMHVAVTRVDLADGPAYLAFLTDITAHKNAEKELERRAEDLVVLNTIAAAINQSPNLDAMLRATLDQVLTALQIRAGAIHLLDPGRGCLVLEAERGLPSEDLEPEIVEPSRLLSVDPATLGQPLVVMRPTDTLWFSRLHLSHAPWPYVAVPLRSRDKTIGILSLLGCGARATGPQGLQFLAALGNEIGAAVRNAQLAESAAEVQVLRELDILRSGLIANVSHELRTPLGLIKLFCTTLQRQDVVFPETDWRDFLSGIEDESDKLEAIVNNLLDLSRIQSGRLRLERHPVNLVALIRDVADGMQSQVPGHVIVRQMTIAEPVVSVDARRIEQVLRNLITNAGKYSPRASAITLRASDEGGQILIQVSDRGIGIPSGDLERVFERFYRVDNETTRRIGGVGLGLAICQSIVEAHGGRIWVESQLHAGSTFSFTLPGTEPLAALCDPAEPGQRVGSEQR